MANGSLSQQRTIYPSGTGLSRTQRVEIKQAESRSQTQYSNLKSEAERLRKSVFVDTPENPLTLERYRSEYEKLSPELKEFFLSPQNIVEQQTIEKESGKKSIDERIQKLQERLNSDIEAKERYKEYWRSLSAEEKRNKQDYYYSKLSDFDIDIDQSNNEIYYLKEGKLKIDEGYKTNDVIAWAIEKADYERRIRESQTREKEKFQKDLTSGNLDTSISTLGLSKEGLTYGKYKEIAQKYNEEAQAIERLRKWSDSVGFGNLPQSAQEKLNPEAVKFQKSYPTEKLFFDSSGNVIGVESGILGKSLSVEEYNKIAQKQALQKQQTPDQIYATWQKELLQKPVYMQFKTIQVDYPYETRGTFNTKSSSIKIVPKTFGEVSESFELPLLKNVASGIKSITSKAPEVNIPIFIGAGGSVKVKDVFDPVGEKLVEYKEVRNEKLGEMAPNKKKIYEVFQQEYQTNFEYAYMKKLIYGEIDFETASKEFEKSETAKDISQRYSTAISEDLRNLPFKTKVKEGLVSVSIDLALKAINLVPRNYGELVVESAVVYTGYKGLKYIPSTISNLATGASFAYGAYKTFSPKSTPAEVGGGIITSTITGTALAYSGYKYFRQPELIYYDKISAKTTKLTASNVIGKDIKVISSDKTIEKVIYEQQKLSQVGKAGQRIGVTSKIRSLLNKYLNFNIEPIYSGIPSQGKYYSMESLRGKYLYRPKSPYQKALDRLIEYKIPKTQARSILRYSAPVIKEQWLQKGTISLKGEKASTGKFIYETRQPVVMIDENLNIKSRGAKTIRDTYTFKRKIIEINDKQFMQELRRKISTSISRTGKPLKLREYGLYQSKSYGKESELLEGPEWIGKKGNVNLYKDPSLYKEIKSITKEESSIVLKPKRKYNEIEIDLLKDKYSVKRTILFNKEIDLTSNFGKKVVMEGQRSNILTNEKINNFDNVVNKVSEKISQKNTAKIAETIGSKNVESAKALLKSEVQPQQVQISKTSSIPKVAFNEKVNFAQLTGLSSQSALKSRSSFKFQNSLKNQLKELLKPMTSIGQIEQTKQRTQQITQTAQIQTPRALLRQIELITERTPTLLIPSVPKTPRVRNKPFIFFGGEQSLKEKIKKKKKKGIIETFGLFPDFTSRSVGLSPRTLSVEQALKEMNKIQTGFEVRSGARIKGYGNINEKNLMRGIMQ